ncbi:FAD-binding domain-containing protein [Aspergillus californicus]
MARFSSIAVLSLAIILGLLFRQTGPFSDGIETFVWAESTAEKIATELRPQLSNSSNILEPGNPQWEHATERFDQYSEPNVKLVVQPGEEADVPKIVRYANRNKIRFLVVNRGHGMSTTLNKFEGMMIDMSKLRKLSVTAGGKTAWIQGGAVAGEVIDSLWNEGYVTATGSTPCVGLLGVALGGGRGRLEGTYGLMSDNFVTLNVVLANGISVRVSEDSNPDLFWAMKGAGHNFGIVTSLEVKLYPRFVEQWYYKNYVWPQDKLETIFEQLNAFHNNGSHTAKMAVNYGVYTLVPPISETEPVIWWSFAYAGPEEEAQQYLDAFDKINAIHSEGGTAPYNEIAAVTGTGMDAPGCNVGNVHMHCTAALQVWNATAQRQIYDLYRGNIQKYPVFSRSIVIMEDYAHERVAAIDAASSAYALRDRSLLNLIDIAYTPDSALDAIAYEWASQTRDLWNQGQPDLLPATYVNYAHGDESAESMYGYEPWRLEKLRQIKAEVDPLGHFDYFNSVRLGEGKDNTKWGYRKFWELLG